MKFLGNGEVLIQHGRIFITTPSDVSLTDNFDVLNTTNFPTLIITKELDGLIDYDEVTGILTLRNSGYLTMHAAMNFVADQSSANLLMIPEFDLNDGNGFHAGIPRKKALTAIRPDQVSWSGEMSVIKGSRMRFCFSKESGNISLTTETLDLGGSLETILPAVVFYVALQRKFTIFK